MEPPQRQRQLAAPSDRGERQVIDRLLATRGAAPAFVTLDAGHDCAVVHGSTAVTTDTLVEGVHFDARTPPEDVGYKVVAVSVSDLAAARATPEWMVLAVSLPDPARWLAGFAEGVGAACARFGVYLVGGDVTRGERCVVTSTLGGAVRSGVRGRAGAREGDEVWVTGWPGLAGAGWMLSDPPPEALRALRRPEPPLAFALALDCATAAMDLSDGLRADLPRLCAMSAVGARIEAAALPLHAAIADQPERLRLQVCGGDDYQLLFTAPRAASDRVRALAAQHAVPVWRIGEITAGAVELVGAEWPAPAFSHFDPVGAG